MVCDDYNDDSKTNQVLYFCDDFSEDPKESSLKNRFFFLYGFVMILVMIQKKTS